MKLRERNAKHIKNQTTGEWNCINQKKIRNAQNIIHKSNPPINNATKQLLKKRACTLWIGQVKKKSLIPNQEIKIQIYSI